MELQKWDREEIVGEIKLIRLPSGDIDTILAPRKRYKGEKK